MTLKTVARPIYRSLRSFGLDPRKLVRAIRGVPVYISNAARFHRQRRKAPSPMAYGKPFPCFSERYEQSGVANGHYFHQDLLVAQRIYNSEPDRHVDVGSRIDGLVAHVATFRQIDVIDIRPLQSPVANIRFHQADMMASLPSELRECADSVSCLHALEHFGLGRYGDPIDHDGHRRGLDNMIEMIKPGGTLYLSVPIGQSRVEFDAHRVFTVADVLALVADRLSISAFAYVDDDGYLHSEIETEVLANSDSFGCRYGCGIFEMNKKA